MDYGQLVILFDEETAGIIRNIMLNSEYRNAASKIDKVDILRKYISVLNVVQACKIVGISTKTYYKKGTAQVVNETETIQAPPRQLLSPVEEEQILHEIHDRQVHSDCMSGKDIRKLAETIYLKRIHQVYTFDKHWYQRFLKRHNDLLSTGKIPSLTDERGELEYAAFEVYFEQVINALERLVDLRLLINMDESGFGSRPDKGKRKKCVFFKDCKTPPVWREKTDGYHISWVCAITASCDLLRPVLITPRKTQDPEYFQTFLPKFADIVYSSSGYQTNTTMLYWIENVLTPHIVSVREEIGNPEALAVLIMDGLLSHFHETCAEKLQQLKPIAVIALPAHSSHFTQPCDASLFAATKNRYGSTPKGNVESKYVAKLLRIKNAIQKSVNDEIIYSSWKKCGFNITIEDGICTHVSFSEEFIEQCKHQCLEKVAIEATSETAQAIIDSAEE